MSYDVLNILLSRLFQYKIYFTVLNFQMRMFSPVCGLRTRPSKGYGRCKVSKSLLILQLMSIINQP